MFERIYFLDKTGRVTYSLEEGVLRLKEDVGSGKFIDGSGLFEGLDRQIAKYIEKVPASRIDAARREAFRETREKLLEEIQGLKKRLGDDFVANEFTEREIGGIFCFRHRIYEDNESIF